jgi:hypothetical protein
MAVSAVAAAATAIVMEPAQDEKGKGLYRSIRKQSHCMNKHTKQAQIDGTKQKSLTTLKATISRM